jgi:predicted TIM-barrel fold metal-dependent hydrolase
MYDNENNDKERNKFIKNIANFKNLIHVPTLNKNDCKYNFEKKFKNFRFIKVNPRILNISIENKNFYKKIFKKISNTNLTLLWCTFDGYHNKPCKIDQLNFLSEIISHLKTNKIILMHGGGANILKYYERFRFCENVFLDLSYSFNHFYNSSLIKDFHFLMKNFDKRMTIGSDYPSIQYKKHHSNIINFFRKYKISKIKKRNVLYQNLEKILNA